MGTTKRRPDMPRHAFWWYDHVSKAELVEALIDICARTSIEEGCDDLHAAADQAALEVAQVIHRAGRKPHKNLSDAFMRRPPDEFSVRGNAPTHPKMDDKQYLAFLEDWRAKRNRKIKV